jgi:hypothetical protein
VRGPDPTISLNRRLETLERAVHRIAGRLQALEGEVDLDPQKNEGVSDLKRRTGPYTRRR